MNTEQAIRYQEEHIPELANAATKQRAGTRQRQLGGSVSRWQPQDYQALARPNPNPPRPTTENRMNGQVPRLRMFAGPNGSGKSSIQSVIGRELLGVYINPDDIEKEIREQNQV